MLIKAEKQRKQRESNKKTEIYTAGHKNHLRSKFSRKQQGVLKKHHDFRSAVAKELSDYTTFKGGSGLGPIGTRGGTVPDRVSYAIINDDKGRAIDITITQSYCQPGVRLYFAEAELKYDPDVSKEDVDIVRNALKKLGLEKKTK